MKNAFFAFLFLIPSVSFAAFDFTYTPNGNDVAVSFTFDDQNDFIGWQSGENYYCVALFNETKDYTNPPGDIHDPNGPYPITQTNVSTTFFNAPNGLYTGVYAATQLTNTPCSNASAGAGFAFENSLNWGSGLENAAIYNLFELPYSQDSNIWGSNNGFWGSTTPAAFVGDMTASVQSTGDNVYPLLAFVGIPLGFAIAGYLIYQIKRTLDPVPGNENIYPVSSNNDIVYHSASDLEFKRNYGSKSNKEPRL